MSNSMMMRRRLAMFEDAPPEGLGEFRRGYAATLTPNSTSEWVIQHGLGIVPKLVIIEMSGTPTLNYYGEWAIYQLDVPETFDGKTGFGVVGYHYSSDTSAYFLLPDTTKLTFDAASVTVMPGYNATRSPWDTGAEYSVQVYG